MNWQIIKDLCFATEDSFYRALHLQELTFSSLEGPYGPLIFDEYWLLLRSRGLDSYVVQHLKYFFASKSSNKVPPAIGPNALAATVQLYYHRGEELIIVLFQVCYKKCLSNVDDAWCWFKGCV